MPWNFSYNARLSFLLSIKEFTIPANFHKTREKKNAFKQKKFCKKALLIKVGVAGFELATPCSQSRCANRTALHPVAFAFCGAKIMLFRNIAKCCQYIVSLYRYSNLKTLDG